MVWTARTRAEVLLPPLGSKFCPHAGMNNRPKALKIKKPHSLERGLIERPLQALEPICGLEPQTYALRMRCSTS